MPSLIPGYNCDIFISYRQKDNKGDHWVSEFVEALKTELESTFKEEISVYFDINPHDGLLETHDVNESLKEKLRCLIFIPIVSRTYCDPKSFAWEHEFKAFVEMASKDQFGLRVKLPNGNVASRVLPVRIHDLDQSDIKECETVLGSFLRGIEFIYKEPGVNKPLTMQDDEKQNLNKTKFNIQINRTANGIREIISGLRTPSAEIQSAGRLSTADNKKIKSYTKNLIIGVSSFVLLALLIIIISPLLSEKEIRIAVIPLKNPNRDTTVADISYGFTQDIINNLSSHQLIVRTINSSSQFTERKPTREMMRILAIDYLVDGFFESEGDSLKLRLTMCDASDRQIWSYDPVIHHTQFASLAGTIAADIVKRIVKNPAGSDGFVFQNRSTENSAAYSHYVSAESYYIRNSLSGDKKLALEQYMKAIELDPSFARAWAGAANCYFDEYFFLNPDSVVLNKCKAAIDKAFEIDKNLPEVQLALGNYYYGLRNLDLSLQHYNNALKLQPKNPTALFWTALAYRRKGSLEKSISLMEEALKIEPSRADIYSELANVYSWKRDYSMAEKNSKRAISLQPDFQDNSFVYWYIILRWKGDKTAIRKILDLDAKSSGINFIVNMIPDSSINKELADISTLPPEGIRQLDFYAPRSFLLAQIFGVMKDRKREDTYYDSAKIYLEKELKRYPANAPVMSSLALTYAGLGKYETAIDLARRSYELVPYEKDIIRGSFALADLAFVYMKAGKYENALKEIDFLLSRPSDLTVKLLQTDPKWAALRQQTGFSKLVAKYDQGN